MNYSNTNIKNQDGDNNVYFNVEIANPSIYGGDTPNILAQHSETTTQPIVDVAGDYYLSIVRFSVPGNQIPLTVMQIINGQNNANLTPYTVCLSYDGVDYPVQIVYIPTGRYAQPSAPNPFQDYTNPYYNIYSYEHVLSMINTAIMTSFNLLKTDNPGVATTHPPFLIFDPTTQLISFVVENSLVSPPFGGAGPVIEIWMNSALVSTYLSGFEMFFNGNNAVNSKNYKLVVRYRFNNGYPAVDNSPTANANVSNQYYTDGTTGNLVTMPAPIISPIPQYFYPPGNPPDFLYVSQDYSTLQNWSSFKSIVFTTSSIPVNSEFVPQTISQGLATGNGTGAVSFRPILTDFQISINSADNIRQQIDYFPQGPYRIVDLISNQPITKFDVNIYWTDLFDNLRPIEIGPNQAASIKFLFVRKSSYNLQY